MRIIFCALIMISIINSKSYALDLPNTCKELGNKFLGLCNMGNFDKLSSGVSFHNKNLVFNDGDEPLRFWNEQCSLSFSLKKMPSNSTKDKSIAIYSVEICQSNQSIPTKKKSAKDQTENPDSTKNIECSTYNFKNDCSPSNELTDMRKYELRNAKGQGATFKPQTDAECKTSKPPRPQCAHDKAFNEFARSTSNSKTVLEKPLIPKQIPHSKTPKIQ